MLGGPLRRVRFLLGRAGSGKTYQCLQELRQASQSQPLGPPLILLVPEQATYQMDRALLEGAERRASLRTQVVSFRRLCYLVLEERLSRRRVLSELGREMVVQALLRRLRDQWQFFDASRVRPGLAAHVSRILHELRQYRVAQEMLQRAALELAVSMGTEAPLVRKLQDLARLLEGYQAFLAQKYHDADDVTAWLTEAIRKAAWLREARLWVDSFSDFTKQEYEVLQALLHTVGEATFSLCLDPAALTEAQGVDSVRLFHRAEETYRRLRGLIPGHAAIEHVYLPAKGHCPRFRRAELVRLECEMFADLIAPASLAPTANTAGNSTSGAQQSGGEIASAAGIANPNTSSPVAAECITLIEARNRRAEVEYAVRTIRQLVQQQGWRYRDVALMVRRLEDYRGLIEAIFPEYGIPFFTDERRSARHHPLVELVRSALRVAVGNWRSADVVRWLRTDFPLARGEQKLGLAIVDRLEQYADEHGLEGEHCWRSRHWRIRAPACEHVPEYLQPDVLNRERLRLTEPLAAFCQTVCSEPEVEVRRALIALWQMLEELRVRDTLQTWQEQARSAGRLDEAAEHGQVWDGLLQLSEELDLAFSDQKLSREDLLAIIETALDSLTLGIVPPSLDQVLVGAIERSRQPELRGVFLLGVNEGVFPSLGAEDAILNDSDREHLAQHGIELAPTAEARHYHEQYFGYIAFTRASERLWVSYALADEQNRPLLPSPFVERLRQLFPTLEPQLVEGGVHAVSWHQALTWHELADALAVSCRDARSSQLGSGAAGTCQTSWPEIVNWLGDAAELPRAVSMVQRAAQYQHRVSLPPTLAEQLFLTGGRLRLSVSELESYAWCPFQFFASSGLRLRARQSFRLSRQDLGQLMHRILQLFVQRYVREFGPTNVLATTSSTESSHKPTGAERRRQLRQLLEEVAASVLDNLEDDRFEATARRQHVLRQACGLLGDYVVALDEQLRRGSFVPVQTELPFGNDEAASVQFRVELASPPQSSERRYLLPRGRIDRIDLVLASNPDSPSGSSEPSGGGNSQNELTDRAVAWLRVVDYKLSPKKLHLDAIYYGLDLQLMLYLCVAQQLYQVPAGRGCAFYASLRRTPRKIASAPTLDVTQLEQEWLRGYRLSGVFPRQAAAVLDHQTSQGHSPIVSMFRKQDGTLGNENQTEPLSADKLESLARCTRRHLRRIGEGILQGQIDPHPMHHRGRVPCSLCAWMSVCRFDPTWDDYRTLESLTKKEVLERL